MTREERVIDIKERALKVCGTSVLGRSEVVYIVNDIYDDFESRTCENCDSWENGWCTSILPTYPMNAPTDKDFGCNKFDRKTHED